MGVSLPCRHPWGGPAWQHLACAWTAALPWVAAATAAAVVAAMGLVAASVLATPRLVAAAGQGLLADPCSCCCCYSCCCAMVQSGAAAGWPQPVEATVKCGCPAVSAGYHIAAAARLLPCHAVTARHRCAAAAAAQVVAAAAVSVSAADCARQSSPDLSCPVAAAVVAASQMRRLQLPGCGPVAQQVAYAAVVGARLLVALTCAAAAALLVASTMAAAAGATPPCAAQEGPARRCLRCVAAWSAC